MLPEKWETGESPHITRQGGDDEAAGLGPVVLFIENLVMGNDGRDVQDGDPFGGHYIGLKHARNGIM